LKKEFEKCYDDYVNQGGKHMSSKTVSLIMIIGGLLLFLASLSADWIGIGAYPGFNYAQLGGMAIGLVFLAYGLQKIRAKNKKK
jgi:hypothetical protein